MLLKKHSGLTAAIASLSIIGASALYAEHGRNFAGSFQMRNVVDSGNVVKFDLHARIFNYSGADISGATVSFAPRGAAQRSPEAADYSGAIGDIAVPYHKFVDVDGTFTIPVREFQAIERGAMPNVLMNYVNADGKEAHDRIELRPDLTSKGAAR